MKVIDLDNKQHTLKLTGHMTGLGNKSDLHLKARDLLKEIYPCQLILEEVSIPLRKGTSLFLDFFIPQLKICVEVHGLQHFQFVKHFHQNIDNFRSAKKRDLEKSEWLRRNNIKLIEFVYNEDIAQWKQKLRTPKAEC